MQGTITDKCNKKYTYHTFNLQTRPKNFKINLFWEKFRDWHDIYITRSTIPIKSCAHSTIQYRTIQREREDEEIIGSVKLVEPAANLENRMLHHFPSAAILAADAGTKYLEPSRSADGQIEAWGFRKMARIPTRRGKKRGFLLKLTTKELNICFSFGSLEPSCGPIGSGSIMASKQKNALPV